MSHMARAVWSRHTPESKVPPRMRRDDTQQGQLRPMSTEHSRGQRSSDASPHHQPQPVHATCQQVGSRTVIYDPDQPERLIQSDRAVDPTEVR
jgi:hypothetical protein